MVVSKEEVEVEVEVEEEEEEASYEELRRKNVEANKRKLEEFKINHLSLTLKEASTPTKPKPSPGKRKVRSEDMEFVVLRRSNRVANLPEMSYKEAAAEAIILRPRRTSGHRKDLENRVYASDEARLYAQNKAENLQAELDPLYPSFVKPMTQSHVTGGFWLGLPKQFCSKHLPRGDTTMILIDESGEEFVSLYLAHKIGLSAGWRGFSINHELVDGDALVFQLINRTSFKVYIIRSSDYSSDGAN